MSLYIYVLICLYVESQRSVCYWTAAEQLMQNTCSTKSCSDLSATCSLGQMSWEWVFDEANGCRLFLKAYRCMSLPSGPLPLGEGRTSWQSASGCHSCGSWKAPRGPGMWGATHVFILVLHQTQKMQIIFVSVKLKGPKTWVRCFQCFQ